MLRPVTAHGRFLKPLDCSKGVALNRDRWQPNLVVQHSPSWDTLPSHADALTQPCKLSPALRRPDVLR